eukprot:CAMPEP_0115752320 /NCGR_PEP_ID=MMETSP0272-20121206/95728_1 /TAXON_ID=71861 /ORGANISM="Scrippsiella trochoidea, Strain CCMP3099" /LENGTH=199 /DNA_ID=CAMNT_0003197561 /DNA_START=8 /DNA_END=605 /DNA_ORIENTATION=+
MAGRAAERQRRRRAGSMSNVSAARLLMLGFAGSAVWLAALSRAVASTAFHLKVRLTRRPSCPISSVGAATSGEAAALAASDPHIGPFSEAEVLTAGVPEEQAAEITKLSEVIAAEGTAPLADPLTLLRFFNARGRDVAAAAAMHREAVEWRRSYGVARLMAEHGEGGEYREDGRATIVVARWDRNYAGIVREDLVDVLM